MRNLEGREEKKKLKNKHLGHQGVLHVIFNVWQMKKTKLLVTSENLSYVLISYCGLPGTHRKHGKTEGSSL